MGTLIIGTHTIIFSRKMLPLEHRLDHTAWTPPCTEGGLSPESGDVEIQKENERREREEVSGGKQCAVRAIEWPSYQQPILSTRVHAHTDALHTRPRPSPTGVHARPQHPEARAQWGSHVEGGVPGRRIIVR